MQDKSFWLAMWLMCNWLCLDSWLIWKMIRVRLAAVSVQGLSSNYLDNMVRKNSRIGLWQCIICFALGGKISGKGFDLFLPWDMNIGCQFGGYKGILLRCSTRKLGQLEVSRCLAWWRGWCKACIFRLFFFLFWHFNHISPIRALQFVLVTEVQTYLLSDVQASGPRGSLVGQRPQLCLRKEGFSLLPVSCSSFP